MIKIDVSLNFLKARIDYLRVQVLFNIIYNLDPSKKMIFLIKFLLFRLFSGSTVSSDLLNKVLELAELNRLRSIYSDQQQEKIVNNLNVVKSELESIKNLRIKNFKIFYRLFMRLGIFELAYTCHTLVEERSKIQIINKNHIIDHQSNSSQIIRTYIKYIKYLKYPEKNLSLPTFTKTNISPFKVTINGPVTRNIDNIINSSSDYYIFPKFNLSHFEQYRKLLLNRKIVSFYQEYEINQSTINSLSILEVGFFSSVKSYKKYVQLKFGNVAIQPIKDYLSPYGYPAHLNKIILNLLYFFNNNLVIDLIGFNFFLEKQIYFYGYRSEKYNSADAFDIKALERFWNFQSFHDLFSDWRLIRDLFKSNLVCVSDEMTPLMKLSERDYFNTLSMLYGLRRGSVI